MKFGVFNSVCCIFHHVWFSLKRLYIIFISLYVYVDYLRVNKLSLLITLYCLQNYKLSNKKIRWYNELKRKTNNIKIKEDKMMLEKVIMRRRIR